MLEREKIKNILSKKEVLRKRLHDSFSTVDGKIYFKFEQSRFENVITKLAKGHAKFENSEVKVDAPDSITITTMPVMTRRQLDNFINNHELHIAPEVGSRALSNLYLYDSNVRSHWQYVQDGVYQYCVLPTLVDVTVKIIIWNYLVAEVIWNN
ncbi:MAG: hypothetical protein PSV16_12640 [Flavobacterium sp.]|nr:hypothetical protein [Flavobacterium sp.]